MKAETDEGNREFLSRLLPNQKSIRNFIYSLHPHAEDLDDIMQDTVMSLWEKFDTFELDREFLPWANRLAYFEVLRFRKKRSRDRLVFSDEMVEQLWEDAPSPNDTEAVRLALDACLCKLDGRAREVVEARYARGASIATLAKMRSESVHQLYRILEKVRLALVSCVQRRLASEGNPFS